MMHISVIKKHDIYAISLTLILVLLGGMLSVVAMLAMGVDMPIQPQHHTETAATTLAATRTETTAHLATPQ